MTIFDEEHRPPEPDEFDRPYAVVRAAVGGIPVLGDAAGRLMSLQGICSGNSANRSPLDAITQTVVASEDPANIRAFDQSAHNL